MRPRMDGVRHKHGNISSAYLYETDAQLYIKQKSQSSVLVKQAKKNSFKMLSSICSPDHFCTRAACFRIKHAGEEHFFTRQPNASAVRFFSMCPCFLILCNILRSVNSRKALKLKFLSKRLVVLSYINQF